MKAGVSVLWVGERSVMDMMMNDKEQASGQ
jgi:hypothetical protein